MINFEVLNSLQLIKLSFPKNLLQTESLLASENVGLKYDPRVHCFRIIDDLFNVEYDVAHPLLVQQFFEEV